ncbi:MAG: ATP-binding protein [Chloroflexota bacterium]
MTLETLNSLDLIQSLSDNLETGLLLLDSEGEILLANSQVQQVVTPFLNDGGALSVGSNLFERCNPAYRPQLESILTPPTRLHISQREVTLVLDAKPLWVNNAQAIQINVSTIESETQFEPATESQLERYKTLLHITSELAYTLEEDLVLTRSLDLLQDAVNPAEASILLIDEDTGEFTIRSIRENGIKAALSNRPTGLWPNMGLAGQVLRKRETIFVPDTRTDSDWIQKSQSHIHRAVIGTPLEFGREGIGVLTLSKTQPNAFSDEDIELVRAAGARISNALYIAHLYDLIRNQAARLGSMLREEQISAAKNQAILESIADGVLVADEEGYIILANDALLEILGVSRRQLVGEKAATLSGLYGSSDVPWNDSITDWQRGVGIQERPRLEDLLTLPDSGKIVQVNLSPVVAGGQFFGTVSIFRDVSAEKEADRVKTEFVSRVSHELRTPLTSIKGYADLMLMGATGALADKVVQYLNVIKSNSNRLHELVGDLLDISQFEAGTTRLDFQAIDVEKLLNETIFDHLNNRIKVDNKPMRVEIDVADSLPKVEADRLRTEQIIINLVDNAFNYTNRDGLIKITAKSEDNDIVISIEDNGIGIAAEDSDKIFDRFFRAADERVQQVSGTGLGLPIVKTLVDLHNGHISVESQPEQGSTFVFRLPLKQAKE